MRLAQFIRTEMEAILQAWAEFADTILPTEYMSESGLRDHAREMLLAISDELESSQTDAEQTAKSKGGGPAGRDQTWAEVHGSDRQSSGFSVVETVSEFRALRASVVSRWTTAYPKIAGQQLKDLTRFHEAIDQAVAESLQHYATVKEKETRLFGAILRASPDPISVLDLDCRFIYINKATAELFGLVSKKIIGNTVSDLGFSFAAGFQKNLQKVRTDQTGYRGKFVQKFASDKGERFEYLLAPVLDKQQKTEAMVCIIRDITEQTILAEKIWYNAHYDLLTGLPNRGLFLDRLEQEVKHAKRNDQPLALLFMDLDGFKEINDSLGHEAGDKLLIAVAQRLTDCVRGEDTVARLGGDEFTVILCGTKNRSDVQWLAQTIVDALSAPFDIANQPVQISVSIGVSFYPTNATSAAALLQAADHAMYDAKKASASQICFAGNP